MLYSRIKRTSLVGFFLLLPGTEVVTASTFVPPSHITLHIYRLYSSGKKFQPEQLCSVGNTHFGCTAFDMDRGIYPLEKRRPYPYTSNPATIPIETDYLLDVVPQEMDTYYHPASLQAQAIAARTYAYWHINQGYTINNSTSYQAFIPLKFQSLNDQTFITDTANICQNTDLNTAQRTVCNAVVPRYYISYNNDLPAFTEFSADARSRTVAGSQPYLMAVDDPISSGCDGNNSGHGRGMSQKGASRWARGNRCSYSAQGNDPWSVRWGRAEQILVHYYTGIYLRDANNSNRILTPFYRWNPLHINWGVTGNHPPTMTHGLSYPVSIQVQDTGLASWSCGVLDRINLGYHWRKAGYGEKEGSSYWLVCNTSLGDPSPTAFLTIANIPPWGPGAYTIRFDVKVTKVGLIASDENFWFSERGWPSYDVSVCVDGPCKVFIPLALKNY